MTGRLPIPVRRVVGDAFDDTDADAAWRRRQLARASARSAPPRLTWSAALFVGLAAAAALVFAIARGASEPGPLHLASGALPTELVGAGTFPLDDGSSITLGDEARLETLENEGRAFGVLMHAGASTFDVAPGGPRRWTIECGLATVIVVGTRFTIERASDRLRVSVEHGVVLVRGEHVPEGARRLGAGESLEVVVERSEADGPGVASTRDEATAGRDPAPVAGSPVSVLVEPTTTATPSAEAASATDDVPRATAREPSITPSWRDLARDTAYDEAYAALGREGLEREAAHASVDDLLTLADVARLSGHPADAIDPLERIVSEHPTDAQAPLAAFTLGTVEAGSMRRPDRAARAFERALELGITRALRADTLARLATARRDAGDVAGTREAASQYLAEFPEGPRAPLMSELAGATP